MAADAGDMSITVAVVALLKLCSFGEGLAWIVAILPDKAVSTQLFRLLNRGYCNIQDRDLPGRGPGVARELGLQDVNRAAGLVPEFGS